MTDPPSWKWYRTYCILMALLNLAGIAYGVAVLVGRIELPLPQTDDPDVAEAMSRLAPSIGWSLVVTGLAFVVLNVAILYLPRRPWAYGVHLINIVLGFMSCILIPLCIPLLVSWLKPQTKNKFGMEGGERANHLEV